MKVEYAPRAVADLADIGAHSRKAFGDSVAIALETTIRATVARIALMPQCRSVRDDELIVRNVRRPVGRGRRKMEERPCLAAITATLPGGQRRP